jgi:DNA-binding transcriptional regulator of glucitol operon
LLSPAWLWRHALVVAAFYACLRLGIWQLHRAERIQGTIQNWGYAFEWWTFAAAGAVWWFHVLRTSTGPPDTRDSKAGSDLRAAPATALGPRPPQRLAEDMSDEDDPELAAYNRYLADLHARSR